MDRNPDIYSDRKKPEHEPPKSYTRVDMNVSPAEMRARAWRSTFLFTTLMLVLLGLASWIIMRHEDRRDVDEDLEEGAPSALQERVHRRTVMPETVPEWEPADYTDMSQPGLDPAKIAQAMGELRMAGQYVHAGEFEKAQVRAQKALGIWPDMAGALRVLAFAYTQQGKVDQAIRALERAKQLEPFNAINYSMLAACHMHKGRMTTAEDMFRTALDIQPDYPVARLNLGMLYLATGRYEQAAEYLEDSIEHFPHLHKIRNNLAVALLRIGALQDAREHLHLLIHTDPHTPAWYFNMAITYTEERDFEEAMEWIRLGANYCSPITFQRFISDPDFHELRQLNLFRELIQGLYPGLPVLPEG